ncbi:hypothetical protein [Planctomicrobium piriforme]|uniref:Uncharacterized protein n=1 Tax=Planctomicrobium piriforme TaxID=1576369 RepID=A0A1I3H3E4_9PLAN|nr:hypothetical protein [Planctomicrobium piriforme]SFI30070.1 hypothetical protein SAMN05421753_107230 [Planctomicrobium piriforme]
MQFFRLMGIVPLGIGITVLGFLWLTPFNEFHSPPLFFRIFASFIALGFILQGGAMVSGKLLDPKQWQSVASQLKQFDSNSEQQTTPAQKGYVCQHCGAPLAANADVSPHGDVKCGHCGKWFNIHARA